MSEHDANLLTLWLVSLAFPIVGIAKMFLANVMVRNTYIRTRIGDWLVRMFVAIGCTFVLIGLVYGLTLADTYQWLHLPAWGRWGLRLAAVTAVLLSLLSTAMLVRSLVPLLHDLDMPSNDGDGPHSVGRELIAALGIIAAASLSLLGVLMLVADWV